MQHITRVAVIGTGTIGASWVALFLAHGLQVSASDPGLGAEQALRRRVAAHWPALRACVPACPQELPERALRFSAQAEVAVAEAEWIQENGPEDLRLKAELFGRLDRAAPPQSIIASSSSGLVLHSIQTLCARPERCVIGHPFNPPHLIPLVEVVGSASTAAWAIADAMAFYRRLGKHPIHLRREVPGHVANRLQAALWREAIHLVDAGVASVEDVDAALRLGPGLRWAIAGAHMSFHLGGGDGGLRHFMDHLLGPMHTWWDDLGKPRMTPQLQRRLVDGVLAEAGGRSTAELAAARDQALLAVLQVLGQVTLQGAEQTKLEASVVGPAT